MRPIESSGSKGQSLMDSISERKKHLQNNFPILIQRKKLERLRYQTLVLKWMNTLMLARSWWSGKHLLNYMLFFLSFFLFSSYFLLPLISFFPFFLPYFFPSSPSLPALLSSLLFSFLFLPVAFNLNIHSGRNQQLDVTICITTVFILMLWIW